MKKNKQDVFALKAGFLACLLMLFCVGIHAQTKTISGTVLDATGETVIAASVVVKGTTIGTVTDYDGHYTLDVPADAKTLVFSFMGMRTEEVAISGSVINVTMQEDNQLIDEVVVTGYGTTKKRDLVTSVASVSAEQLKDIPVTSAAEAIQGKMAGVQVTTTEGSPDADIKIRVRGGSSLTQSSEPLYIVDGFPVSNINDIPPSSILSIDVLKDAASTAIYGAQGANGVIIVTTKDADFLSDGGSNKFKLNVDYTGYWGFKHMAKRYEMMDSRDFTLMQYEYAYLQDRSPEPGLGKKSILSNFNAYFDPYYNENGQNKDFYLPVADVLDYAENAPYTDWQDETFGNMGMNMNHSVTVNGGNKLGNFSLSYNRIDDKGIMYESDYVRNNLSLKANIKPIKNLTVNVSGRYTNTEVLGAGANTAEDAGSKTESRVRNAIAYTPIALFQKDLESLEDEESYGGMYDPITTINDNYKFKTDDRWTVQGYVRYKLLKKITLKSDWGYERRNVVTDRFYGTTTYFSRAGADNPLAGRGYSAAMVSGAESSKFRNANTIEYKDVYKDVHNFSVLVGEETIMNDQTSFTEYSFGYDGKATGREVFADKYQYQQRLRSEYISPNDNMLSLFSRIDYNLFSRYYISVTMRADASTRFAKENQWGFFPASALAWRMSDEPWLREAMEAADVSDLKWRFSYGVAGNNNVDLGYLYNQYVEKLKINPILGAYIGLAPYDSGFEGNSTLKWETTTTRNLGLDYAFFNSRLSGCIDIYLNTTDNLIIANKLASGKSQYQNVGATENRGLEFSVKGVILDKRTGDLNFGLSADANISFNKSKVISLGDLDEYNVTTNYIGGKYLNSDAEFKLKVGEELGRVWGYVYDGWYTTDDFNSYDSSKDIWLKDGEVVSTPLEAPTTGARPGTMKLKDISGPDGIPDGVLDDYDKTVIGNTMPLFTGGFSINGNIGSKNWGTVDLMASFTFSYGNDVVNLTGLDLTTIVDKTKLRNNLATVAYGKRYSLFTANGDYIPATVGDNYELLASTLTASNANATIYNPYSTSNALTTQVVEDGSFLRFSALTIGYSLPDKWINKAYITKARIFFSASNLFCLTNYSGADPEVDTGSKRNPLATGVDFSAYPKTRAFNFGINLSF